MQILTQFHSPYVGCVCRDMIFRPRVEVILCPLNGRGDTLIFTSVVREGISFVTGNVKGGLHLYVLINASI